MMVRMLALLTLSVVVSTPLGAQTVVYSQTSLAASSGRPPGLFDQLGLLAGPGSRRVDFYEIFTNNGPGITINKVVLYGTVDTVSTAMLVPAILGTANNVPNILVPDRDPAHVLSTASVLPTSGASGPIEVYFSTPVYMPSGAFLAFGFQVPLSNTVDATLLGTDTLPNSLSSTSPPYYTGFYATNSLGELILAAGNHYLVVESAPLDIQQVITFFDGAVTAGRLVGNGPGSSADGRLKAFRNMLTAAAHLITSGNDASEAVTQLEQAYQRTDGDPEPTDFVTGPDAASLAARILQLIAILAG